MSWQASHWAKETRGHKTITDKALLLILGDYAHPETWEAYPSQDRLAADLECSKRTIQRSLDVLEAGGFLTQLQTGNQYQRSIYRLNGASHVAPAQVQASESDNLTHATLVTDGCDTGDARSERDQQDSSDSSKEKSSSSSAEDDEGSLYWVALETFYQSLPMKGIDPELRSFSAYRRGVQEKGDKLQQVDLRLCSEFALMIRLAFGRWPGWERIVFPTPGWLPGLQVAALASQRGALSIEGLRKAIETFVSLSAEREDPHKPHEGWPGWVLTAIAQQPGVFATALVDARQDEAMRAR